MEIICKKKWYKWNK